MHPQDETSESIEDLLANAEYLEDDVAAGSLPAASQSSTTKSAPDIATESFLSSQSDADLQERGNLEDGGGTKTPMKSSQSSTKTSSQPQKRQLALTDMFTLSQSNKRQRKISTSSNASSSGSILGASPAPRKLVNGLTPFNSIPFNMDAFQAQLSEEERKLLDLECKSMGRTWMKVLANEIRKPYFLALKRYLWKEGVQGTASQSVGSPKIYPPPEDIYNWSRTTPLGKVKVVIIGQDPYHGPKQAHGLCFSVRKGVPVPPSLKNMYKEITADYPSFVPPKHGDLSSWAEGGVLLINTCLTVRSGEAGSHNNQGWETFTDTLIDLIDKYAGASLTKTQGGVGRGVVFLAWGAWAAKRVAKLSTKKHLVLKSVHPSPLSAHRGFFGNEHFRKANNWLEEKYGKEALVDWTKLD